MTAITITDLNNAKLDVDHIAKIATSVELTATDRIGATKRTIAGISSDVDSAATAQRNNIQSAADLVLAGAGYAPPVLYAAGINLTLKTQTVEYAGNAYAPKLDDLPFTTSGTFEAAKFRLIQGVAAVDLAAADGAGLSGYSGALNYAVGTIGQALKDIFVNVKAFPWLAKGDGITDDTAAIQAALNWAIYGPSGSYAANALSPDVQITVHFPKGGYKTSDTLHCGYGTSFTSLNLTGEFDQNYTGIIPTFNDRPCLAIQGGRRVSISKLRLVGVNEAHVKALAMTDRSVLSQWTGPNLSASSLSRYAPYCGIAIDPYSGVKPGAPYPNVVYPAFLGAVAQYGKNFTSQVIIDNCSIAGFGVGLMIQPCDADGNGDFVSMTDTDLSNNIYGQAIGNSQARLSHRRNVNFSQNYTCIDTKTFGRQQGNAAGDLTGCCFDRSYQIFNISTSFTTPIKALGCYAENLYRIGAVSANTGLNYPISFDACKLSLNQMYGTAEYTTNRLIDAASSHSIEFVNSAFSTNTGAFYCLGAGRAKMRNMQITNGTIFDETTIAGKVAKTASLGIWDDLQALRRRMDVGLVRNQDLYNFAGTAYTSENQRAIDCDFVDIGDFNNMPLPYWTKRVGTSGNGTSYELSSFVNTGALTIIVQTGREYALSMATPFQVGSAQVPVGAIVIANMADPQLFYVKSVSIFGSNYVDLVLVQLTNVRQDAGVWSVKTGKTLTSSGLYIYNCAKFYPCSVPVYAETVAASPTLTLKVMGSATADASALGVLAIGDRWDGGLTGNLGVASSSLRATVIPNGAVTAITTASGTATLGVNARFSGQFAYPVFIKNGY